MEQLARYNAIVKWIRCRAYRLISFMAFSGYDDGVTFFRVGQRRADSLASIHDHSVLGPAHSVFDFVDDRHRIFTARIVRCNEGVIAVTRRDFPHQRTLGAVAFASAAEDND